MIAANYKQYFAKRNSNPLLRSAGIVCFMAETGVAKLSARVIVARNLARLMEESATLNTQEKVGKKAGVKQRTVGYLLNPNSTDMKSPKLDTVEKVARAFGLEPWVLLADPEKFGKELAQFLQRPVTTEARLAELGREPLPEKPSTVRGGKRGRKRSLV